MLVAALSVALLVSSQTKGSVWRDPWFVVSVVFAAVAFAILVTSGIPDLGRWLHGRAGTAPSATITSPLNDQIVPHAVWARGSAVNVANGITLWLVILAGGRSYYPQAKVRLPANGSGTWDQLVHFGRVDGSGGHHYTLYAVGADAAAARVFEDHFRQMSAGRDPGPLSDAAGTYPDVTTFASTHVIRAAPERKSG